MKIWVGMRDEPNRPSTASVALLCTTCSQHSWLGGNFSDVIYFQLELSPIQLLQPMADIRKRESYQEDKKGMLCATQ